MRAIPLVLAGVLGAALSSAAPALADGPIFAIVPNAPSSVTTTATAGSPPPQLTLARLALRDAKQAEQRDAAAAARESALANSTQLLSAQLDAQMRASEFQTAFDEAAAQRSQLEQQIAQLTAPPPPPPPPPTPSLNLAAATPGTDLGAQAVSIAERFLGVPYRWGGADPTGFDCSGFVMYVYAQLGIQLPHYAASQYQSGAVIDPSQLQSGDLVFFEPQADGPGHVAIYVGGDEIIEAPQTGDVVKLASLSATEAALGFVGATRPSVSVATNPFTY
ncbi:MAG TPA: C40 family peptidase [Gaiellaceae bacterium]